MTRMVEDDDVDDERIDSHVIIDDNLVRVIVEQVLQAPFAVYE
jgi:hypothetical protein